MIKRFAKRIVERRSNILDKMGEWDHSARDINDNVNKNCKTVYDALETFHMLSLVVCATKFC